MYPFRLAPDWREKPDWGSQDLRPLFGSRGQAIGEVWFTSEENTVTNGPWAGRTLEQLMERHGAALLGTAFRPQALRRRSPGEAAHATAARASAAYFPLLVKFLFTSAKLSVQVHPGDAYALTHENGLGKTEMWYILRADAGASIALGLTETLSRDRLAEAARSGEIERYLNWIPVQPGDVVYCPAGTIHSIGPGLALCEVQQNSDLTYRLYDFGRPRPLHVDQGVQVATLEPHPGLLQPAGDDLVSCEHFHVERLHRSGITTYDSDPTRLHLLIFLAGRGALAGEPYHAGDVYLIPASLGSFEWHSTESTVALRAFLP